MCLNEADNGAEKEAEIKRIRSLFNQIEADYRAAERDMKIRSYAIGGVLIFITIIVSICLHSGLL